MVYLSLGKNSVKVISMTKTLLGQYTIAHFAKTHPTQFISDGLVQSTDIVVGAIKEALSSAQPAPIQDREVTLTLPQEMFTFARYVLPADIAGNALAPFVQDKIRTDLKLQTGDVSYDYFVKQHGTQRVLFLYALKRESLETLRSTLSLIQLKLNRIIPETLAYYTLFEKTLRQDKKEYIMFAHYAPQNTFSYAYDSAGLLKDSITIFGDDFKTEMHALVTSFEQEGTKLNRLILSGSESRNVRQDLFTKDVGVWTNPLEKIIDNFYKDFLKAIAPQDNSTISILQHDVCFGSFIFSEEHKEFTLMQTQASSSPVFSFNRSKPQPTPLSMPARQSSNQSLAREIFNLKTFTIFIISSLISFGAMYGYTKLDTSSLALPQLPAQKKVSQTPTPTKKPTPTPIPLPDREDLKVKVLNGSGIAGKAGEVKQVLQDAGYTDIVTANASSFDYEKTEVQLSSDSQDALGLVQKDLKDYVAIKDALTIEDEEEVADIIIIVGTDFK